MRIVILGAPGTGRNTQAKHLAEKYGITHISTSDLLSQAVKSDTRLGRQAKMAMDSGHLLADELMPDLILERLGEADTASGFVLVGYPRTLEQTHALEQALAGMDRTLHMGILIEMDQDALIQRLAGRWICGSCGQTFNIYTKPSKMDEQCDECGGDLHHRADDNEETIINRIRVFESQTRPVADYYKQKGHLRVIQGLGDLAVITRAMNKVVDEIDPDHPMPVVLEELPGNDHLSVEELEKRIMEKAMQAKMPDLSLAVDDDPGPFVESAFDDSGVDTLIASDTDQPVSGKESEPDASSKPSRASKKSVSIKKPAKKTTASKRADTKKKKTGTPSKAAATKKAATKKSSTKKKVSSSKKPAQKKKAATKKPSTAKKKAVTKKKTVTKKKKAVVKKAVTKKKAVIKKKKAPVKKKAVAKKSVRKKPATKKKAPVKKKPAVKKKAPVKKKSTASRNKSASKKGRKR